MTNSKVRNSDSAYSICFSQVLLKLFTFLIHTADKEIHNIFNSFLYPYYFITNRTNKQTNKNTHTHTQQLSLIIKIYSIVNPKCTIASTAMRAATACSDDTCQPQKCKEFCNHLLGSVQKCCNEIADTIIKDKNCELLHDSEGDVCTTHCKKGQLNIAEL